MSFDRPYLLLTLLVLPAAAGLYVLAQRRRIRYAVRFTNVDVLATVVEKRSWRRYVPPLVFALVLATLAVGLARPHVKTLVTSDRATVILVVDASRSMQAQDVKPSRLGAAQEAVRRFLTLVPDRLRLGLIVFAGEAQVGAPPTTDHQLVRTSIDTIGSFTGFGGTAIGDALALAVKIGRESSPAPVQDLASVSTAPPAPRAVNSSVSILFLSDGRQNRGILPPLAGAQLAREAGIPVYTVALGTRNAQLPGMPPLPQNQFPGGQGFGNLSPDPATLKAIADVTGGRFFRARSADSLRAAFTNLGTHLGRAPGQTEVTYAFLAGAAGLLLAGGLLSALWSPRLP
jgi:Ca-activated chloride channel family protein